MAPRNSMLTKTWSFERTSFPLKFGQNSRGAKACSQSQRPDEPQIKAELEVENRKDIVYGLSDFSKHIYYFISSCLVSMRADCAFCTYANMDACFTWDRREDSTHSKYVCEHLLWLL